MCVPLMMREGGEGVIIDGDIMILEKGSEVTGLVIDTGGPDASVAMEMCALGVNTDILFHCIT